MKLPKEIGKKFERLVDILALLRSENGCPWDRQQDEESILHYFLEEAYEALAAAERGDAQGLAEELGDVLMEVVFLAQIYKEKGKFTVADSLDQILTKLVRRHPHVFGAKRVSSPAGVMSLWQEQKNAERAGKTPFATLITAAPALLVAFQIGQRAAAYGFDWSGPQEVLSKAREEMGELEKALKRGNRQKIREELGDLFFALVNLSRHLGLNPELTLRRANHKFTNRFKALEARLKKQGKKLGQVSPEEMEAVWREVKKQPRARRSPETNGPASC